jgi:hypothetical protein
MSSIQAIDIAGYALVIPKLSFESIITCAHGHQEDSLGGIMMMVFQTR